MFRLFVAIRPPLAMRRKLLAAMGGIAGARWQDDDQLHLTLRFIGTVDPHRAEDVAAALAGVRHPRFAIALNGMGRFDRDGRIDSLWAAVTPHDGLSALHRKIGQALGRVGIPPDKRAYLPHITIARFGRGAAGAIDPTLAETAGLATALCEIDAFCLYESHLGRAGSRYDIIARYPLA